MQEISHRTAIALVAAGNLCMHVCLRKPLQDVLTATGISRPLADRGFESIVECRETPQKPPSPGMHSSQELLAETLRIANHCHFFLDELKYHYPQEIVRKGETPAGYLCRMTHEGVGQRWLKGISEKIQLQIAHELALICEPKCEQYFLTVYSTVTFSRSHHISCHSHRLPAHVCHSGSRKGTWVLARPAGHACQIPLQVGRRPGQHRASAGTWPVQA